ncbi:uncharacterized [Tachysurus ichikawai]
MTVSSSRLELSSYGAVIEANGQKSSPVAREHDPPCENSGGEDIIAKGGEMCDRTRPSATPKRATPLGERQSVGLLVYRNKQGSDNRSL